MLGPQRSSNMANGAPKPQPGGSMKGLRQNSGTLRPVDNAPATQTVGFAPKQSLAAPQGDGRMEFAFDVLVGHSVEVQVLDGTRYAGVLSSWSMPHGELTLTLQVVHTLEGGAGAGADAAGGQEQQLMQRPLPELTILDSDIVALSARDVCMGAAEVGPAPELQTDALLARGRGGREGRELKRWVPDGDADADMSLEPADGRRGRHSADSSWDQFAANRQMFGVESTYNENLYTTKLDPRRSRISVEDAARIAAEIEGSPATTHHQAEERGVMPTDDSGMDEEDRYSSIARQQPPHQPGGRPHQQPRPQRHPPSQQQHEHQQAAHQQPPQVQQPPQAQQGQQQGGLHRQLQETSSDHLPDQGCEAPQAAPAEKPRPAWSNAGASVAAVSGLSRTQSRKPPGSSASSSIGRTAPVAIDARAELNRITGAKDRSSPYGTPKNLKSPLSSSPLVNDAAAIDALALEMAQPRFGPGVRKAFMEFKRNNPKADRGPPSASQSPSDASQGEGSEFLRTEGSERSLASMAGPSAGRTAPGARPASTLQPLGLDGRPLASSMSSPGKEAAQPQPQPAPEPQPGAEGAPAAAAGTAPAALHADGADTATPVSAGGSSSRLNPKAKEFKLNVNAKAFTPTPAPRGAAASAPATRMTTPTPGSGAGMSSALQHPRTAGNMEGRLPHSSYPRRQPPPQQQTHYSVPPPGLDQQLGPRGMPGGMVPSPLASQAQQSVGPLLPAGMPPGMQLPMGHGMPPGYMMVPPGMVPPGMLVPGMMAGGSLPYMAQAGQPRPPYGGQMGYGMVSMGGMGMPPLLLYPGTPTRPVHYGPSPGMQMLGSQAMHDHGPPMDRRSSGRSSELGEPRHSGSSMGMRSSHGQQ